MGLFATFMEAKNIQGFEIEKKKEKITPVTTILQNEIDKAILYYTPMKTKVESDEASKIINDVLLDLNNFKVLITKIINKTEYKPK